MGSNSNLGFSGLIPLDALGIILFLVRGTASWGRGVLQEKQVVQAKA